MNTLKSYRIILKQFLKWERACIHDQKQHFINTDFQEIFSYTLEPYFYLQCHVWGIESAEQNILIRLILICYLHLVESDIKASREHFQSGISISLALSLPWPLHQTLKENPTIKGKCGIQGLFYDWVINACIDPFHISLSCQILCVSKTSL